MSEGGGPERTGSDEPAPARILMVDDRAENLLTLEAVLEPLGFEMVAATSGAEALQQLLARDFAVIILDVQMPVMDGLETARLIRGRERTRHVPIVFLTAISGEPNHFLAGYDAGAIDYVYKPYNPAVLRAKVGVLVEYWRRGVIIEQQKEALAARLSQLQRVHATVRRQTIELERSNLALERMAEGAAAQLRRPITQAKGFIELALAPAGAPRPLESLLAHALDCLGRASATLDEVVNVAVPNFESYREGTVDLTQVVDSAIESLSSAPDFDGRVVRESPLPAVKGHAEELELLVTELLRSACARLEGRPGGLRVTAELDRGGWRLAVTGEALNWAPADMVRALTLVSDEGGDLMLARRVAERQGWSIGAETGAGGGTSLWARPEAERS